VIAFPLFFIKALKRFYVILMSAVDGCSGSINRMEIKKCGEQRISGEQLKTLSHRALLMESTFRKHCRRKGKNTRGPLHCKHRRALRLTWSSVFKF
jgi:hypothetical protein